ncbi:carboxymuconolactone decarboxylase family protein [Mucilaginibacter pedocola]|uniref:Carboxymuconolactone decarboxylase-like domain-containing protein n=1 Tax=Mucilaginibacter pedocola TaxID=1792845 RepID=A0A1S9P761_9SPHI|nr:carboxymuconolactone decarboxylase family protein [Mucilaginibacter pedocola]OOQ56786.1 hypothetical protein BC343_17525 [Mucilaginibacter pedocola]
MIPFTVPVYEEGAEPESVKPIYARFSKTLGHMPNLYAAIGHSPNALTSYLQYTGEQAKGTFHAKDREGIFLIVSQLNGCEYCLAAHTASALKAGWTSDETVALRKGKHADAKWQVIYKVTKSIIDNKGEVGSALLDEFYALGFKEAAIIDLLTLVNVMSYTNYAYRLMQIPIDFPLAPEV